MSNASKIGGGKHRQYAALPVRPAPDGRIEVLLLTSRDTRRWVIPKGWPMPRLSPAAVAAREAYEEAGLEGRILGEAPIGHYRYDKQRDNGRVVRVRVGVFLMRVTQQLEAWPEQAERETFWFDPEAAATLVAEAELAAILRSVSGMEIDT